MSDKFVSNLNIDLFVEKIYIMGVSKDDIDDYLHLSIQFEITDNPHEKMKIIDNLFLSFETNYPDLFKILEDDINQVYFENRPDF